MGLIEHRRPAFYILVSLLVASFVTGWIMMSDSQRRIDSKGDCCADGELGDR